MSIKKRDDSPFWQVDIRPPGGGPRIRRSTETTNKVDAQQYHDRLKAQLWRQNKLQELPQKKWEDAVKRWLLENARLKSLRDRKDHLLWASQYLAGKVLTSINVDVCEELIARKLAEPVRRGIGRAGLSFVPDPTKTVSLSTVNRHMASVRAVLHAAKEWGWLAGVPKIRELDEPDGIVRYLVREEVTRLLAELPDHLAYAAGLSLLIGQRMSNVLHMPWSQVDLNRGAAWVMGEDAKSGEAIPVPLNAEAVALLRDRRETQLIYETWIIKNKPERLLQVKAGHKFVFTYRGKAIDKASTKAWKDALVRAGIKNFRWHDWRHTWASWHRMSGTPTDVLQQLGGWKTQAMVERYAHQHPGYLAQFAASFKPFDGHEIVDEPGQAKTGS